jgi:DNA-binding LytR/AlgR family response regulator
MISIADFIYGKAQDNYVELVYLKNEKMVKTLIRVPLSTLSEKIPSQMIIKCHRSYIVNLFHVRTIMKGSEMKLFLNYIDKPIRVSKSYHQEVDDRLKQVKIFN